MHKRYVTVCLWSEVGYLDVAGLWGRLCDSLSPDSHGVLCSASSNRSSWEVTDGEGKKRDKKRQRRERGSDNGQYIEQVAERCSKGY